ncbi:unnamed protein product [Mytilus edulis]|uniref:Uncharacterized protein n=1 Tax=Mytilus edulis TaxID=6550 RepID=A0A8S3V7R7_MYTED|nr:unnamed protein product [Mytilus edulis]
MTTLTLIQWSVASITTEENDICKPCKPGKFGRQCSETCLYGYYGNQCKGVCYCTEFEGCDPVEGCPEGKYGENCVNVCHCLRGISCDSVTGSCLCPAGLTGPTCTTKCPTDFYGENCSEKCHCSNGQSCHPIHGTCQCLNGTSNCENPVTNSNRSSITLVIAVSCSGGSLIIVCSYILTICFFKRKHAQENVNVQARRPLPDIHHYDEINPYDEIPSEDLPVASDSSDIAILQIHRLSLQNTNGQMNNRTQNDECRGYISLPNLNNDGTYLNPYNSLQPFMIDLRNNSTEQSLRRVDSEHSGYLHPYHTLQFPFEHHGYTTVKKETVFKMSHIDHLN